MRSLAFILLIAAAPALAQVRPVKRPSSALDAKDDADEAPPPSRGGGGPLCADADRALARALFHAFEQAPEEIRILAIEDLGLLGDPRALDPLAHLVLDPNPRIQSAALRAASVFTTTRATQILENIVRHPRLSHALKAQALRALPFHRRVRAREFLLAVSKTAAYPLELRRVAQEALSSFDLSQPPLEVTK